MEDIDVELAHPDKTHRIADAQIKPVGLDPGALAMLLRGKPIAPGFEPARQVTEKPG